MFATSDVVLLYVKSYDTFSENPDDYENNKQPLVTHTTNTISHLILAGYFPQFPGVSGKLEPNRLT